eukprot:403374610
MNKVVLAIFGLVAVAQAATEIIIKPTDFVKLSTPKSLLKSLLRPKLQGPVTWGECAGGDGDFQVDLGNTYSHPLKSQSRVAMLNLNSRVYVEWNKTPLYVNDFSRAKHYAAGDDYTDEITWLVASFAPSGHYAVQVTLHDKTGKVVFDCISADFDL